MLLLGYLLSTGRASSASEEEEDAGEEDDASLVSADLVPSDPRQRRRRRPRRRAQSGGGGLRIPRYADDEDEGALLIVKAALLCEPGSPDDVAVHDRMRELYLDNDSTAPVIVSLYSEMVESKSEKKNKVGGEASLRPESPAAVTGGAYVLSPPVLSPPHRLDNRHGFYR